MIECRYLDEGVCRLNRFGARPSEGTCRHCQKGGHDRIKGAGDLVHLTIGPVAKRVLPLVRSGKCGCSERQRKMNQMLPIGRSKNDG